jgi:hypothetical protein
MDEEASLNLGQLGFGGLRSRSGQRTDYLWPEGPNVPCRRIWIRVLSLSGGK